jgi:hypothetical protein
MSKPPKWINDLKQWMEEGHYQQVIDQTVNMDPNDPDIRFALLFRGQAYTYLGKPPSPIISLRLLRRS